MHQEKLFKIPQEILICGSKFVDQCVNGHVPITGGLRYLIATTPSHLNIIVLSLLFPLWLGLAIVLLFLFFDKTLSFHPVQEHLVTLDHFMASHISGHMRHVVSLVTCPEGHLCKINMKMLWRL